MIYNPMKSSDQGYILVMSDFLTYVLFFGVGFIISTYIISFFKPTEDPSCKNNKALHSWYYGTDGFMKCRVCGKKALDD